MNYTKLSVFNNKEKLYEMWNEEFGSLFPITKELFERNTNDICDDASYVALDHDKVVGFIIGKTWESNFVIGDYEDSGWISLIYVHPKYRNKGIGTKLLELAETEFDRLNKKIIHIGRDYNDFFPGLPIALGSPLEWFEKRGYIKPYDTCDLINKNKEKIALKNKDLEYRLATLDDKEKILQFMERNWPGRWTKETIDYWSNGGTGREYLICIENSKVIAFAKIGYPDTSECLIGNSQTWRGHFKALGGIGPLGVDKDCRGRHIGFDIVAEGKNILIDANASDIIIDWTGLTDFYARFGFELWESYHYLTKTKKETKK
ncbi:MAG: GNAT family N-acetyltransferase [Bacilli bacterium]|nr:GNAT family N-acetyltransferase [Bacilli bacterium]